MGYLVNVNHAVSSVGYWIFDSNYERALVIDISLLDTICAPSIVEEEVATFETAFCDVIYIRSTEHLKKS